MAGGLAVGTGFCASLSRYIVDTYKGQLADLLVFVPTARLAARLRASLAAEVVGVLPAVLPLKGNGELADLLGIERQTVANAACVRLEICRFLLSEMEDDGDVEGQQAVSGARLWKRVDGLYRLLDRLALHGVSVRALRQSVPDHLTGYWDVQAATLIAVAEHLERWLTKRGETLPGGSDPAVLEEAARILNAPDCQWVPVVAGIVDGTVAARGVAKVAAERGRVVMPKLGPVTAELVARFAQGIGLQDDALVMLGATVAAEVQETVAETEWDEAWLAALGVREALAAGQSRIAVVSPDRALLQRVSRILERWELRVAVSGAQCLDQTPAGRAVLAASSWGMVHGTPAQWLAAMARLVPEEMAGTHDILTALDVVKDCDAWLSHEDWQALIGLMLAESAMPPAPVSDGILLAGPLDARLLDFDCVIAAGAVEGSWPSLSADAWLSEAHLRALGLPDAAHKAMLMGTEFESVVQGGSRHVRVLRARTIGGRDVVRSRFVETLPQLRRDDGLNDVLAALLHEVRAQKSGQVPGVFVPRGDLWPKRWSATLTEALLACPYKAIGERVLRLAEAEPLTPTPDARTAGLLAHRWLERAGKELGALSYETAEQAVSRLLAMAEFEMRHEPAVVRTIWRAKVAKLAPALVDRWLADGRRVHAVEQRLTHAVGPVTMTATLDRVEETAQGRVIIDYKTSTPPSWPKVASGERPQLAIEGWLLQQAADGVAVTGLEYWHLRGYGTDPLGVETAKGKNGVDALLAPVADGVARLVETYPDGADFPAIPDMAGGGLLATGHCERCVLEGVCRRKTIATAPKAKGL